MAIQKTTLGAGCFWCIEAVFQQINGVVDIFPGYAGGHIKNPAYREVCSGRTGHAEVARIKFDDEIISFDKLLDIFWYSHDPTTLNRQGNDVGNQYRSAIFYHDEIQKEKAISSKKIVEDEGVYTDPIVTEITALNNFYKAEDNHKEYYLNNPNQPYCTMVVKPKVDKVKAAFRDKLK